MYESIDTEVRETGLNSWTLLRQPLLFSWEYLSHPAQPPQNLLTASLPPRWKYLSQQLSHFLSAFPASVNSALYTSQVSE